MMWYVVPGVVVAVTKTGPHDTFVNAPGVPLAMRTPAS